MNINDFILFLQELNRRGDLSLSGNLLLELPDGGEVSGAFDVDTDVIWGGLFLNYIGTDGSQTTLTAREVLAITQVTSSTKRTLE